MIAGAVDIGTNSVRLLVVDGEREVERRAVVTRLGAGVAEAGRLDPAAVARTVELLGELRESLDGHGAERVRAVATAVARDAADGPSFLTAAEKVLGVPVEVLSGDEEARLGFRGATAGLDAGGGPYCVVDVGGGSTEFSVGTGDPDGVLSIPVGSVALTESALVHDPPQPEELANALGLVDDLLDDVLRALPAVGEARLVGVAGTVISMAAVDIGAYDRRLTHHFVLTRDAAEDVFRTLATEPLAARVHNPGLQRERADIIVGGCCIVVAVLRRLRARDLLVSESDLLDALAACAAGRSDFCEPR